MVGVFSLPSNGGILGKAFGILHTHPGLEAPSLFTG